MAAQRLTHLVAERMHLRVVEFDRSRPAEDRNGDFHAGPFLVDILDRAVERGERTVGNAHLLADLERDRRLGMLHAFLHLLQDGHGFLFRDRHGLVARTEETGDLGRVLDEVVDVVVHAELGEQVRHVVLDGLFRQEQRLTDLTVRHTFADEVKNLALLFSQTRDGIVFLVWCAKPFHHALCGHGVKK